MVSPKHQRFGQYCSVAAIFHCEENTLDDQGIVRHPSFFEHLSTKNDKLTRFSGDGGPTYFLKAIGSEYEGPYYYTLTNTFEKKNLNSCEIMYRLYLPTLNIYGTAKDIILIM